MVTGAARRGRTATKHGGVDTYGRIQWAGEAVASVGEFGQAETAVGGAAAVFARDPSNTVAHAGGAIRGGAAGRLWRWWLRHSLMFVEVVGNQWR